MNGETVLAVQIIESDSGTRSDALRMKLFDLLETLRAYRSYSDVEDYVLILTAFDDAVPNAHRIPLMHISTFIKNFGAYCEVKQENDNG